MKQPLPPGAMVSVKALAAAAGCSIHTVRRACKDGDMPGAQLIGNTWMIPRQSAEFYAERWVPYQGLRVSKGVRASAPGCPHQGCPPQQPQEG